ncbi:Actin- protein 6, partial [Coemansia furcata]
MNAVKEKCCFVSSNFYRDLDAARGCIGGHNGRNSLDLEYVLPDFTNSKCGYIKGQGGEAEQQVADAETQVLPLCNERFAIPEALFNPADVGLEQGGIHQAVVQAVMACDESLRGVLMANIFLVGGTATLPGLQQRLQSEVQAMSPYRVRISTPEDPTTGAWQGGRMLAQGQPGPEVATYSPATVAEWRLTRAQYQELGPDR